MQKENEIEEKFFIKHEKNHLIERIYDRGKGEKFNDLFKQPTKGKAVRAFITSDEMLEKLNSQVHDAAAKTTVMTRHPGRKTNILNPSKESENHSEKITNFKTDGRSPRKELESITEISEKMTKNIQELDSITGFKVMASLPPKNTTRYKSNDPMNIDRFRITKREETGFELRNDRIQNMHPALEPKFSRPTTTIISIKGNTNGEEAKNFSEIQDTQSPDDNVKLTEDMITLNNMLNQDPNKRKEKEHYSNEDENEYDEDDYMDKINKFIKQAFQGKDYRINFVYYLPSGKENYYDLTPASFKKINQEKVYYTLSAKGLTHYIDKKPREFIKLSDWIIERQAYNYVSNIDFFKNFKTWRILKIWRKNIFKQKRIAYKNELNNHLLFNNKKYNDKIWKHKKFCNQILDMKIIDLRISLESISFDIFIQKQQRLREIQKEKLNAIQKSCNTLFEEGIKRIFTDLQRSINKENNKANYNNDESANNKKRKNNKKLFKNSKDLRDLDDDKDEAILNDDNIAGYENYQYKYKMQVKDECINFIKLAYLYEYIMLDMIRKMYLFSMKDILKKLDEYNMIQAPSALKENVLNKREEYVKPAIPNSNRAIPYLQINCKLTNKPIENRDRTIQKIKPFFIKATPDDEFDPTAHIIRDYEEQEFHENLYTEKKSSNKLVTNRPKTNSEGEIEVEFIERLHNYLISFDPDPENLIISFIKQIDDTLGELKVKGWKAHPKLKKYLRYLDDWDDAVVGWSNEEQQELDPHEILANSGHELYLQKNDIIQARIKKAFSKCNAYLSKLNPLLQLYWKQISINKELLTLEYIKDADEIYRLLFHFTEKNIKTLQKWVPFEEEIGMVKLSMEEHLRKDLIESQNVTLEYLKPILPGIIRERANKIEKWISDMLKSIQGGIESEKQYLEKTKAKESLDVLYAINERKLNTIDNITTLLKSKGFDIKVEDIKNIDHINSLKYQLKYAWDDLNENLSKNRDKLKHIVMNNSIPSLLKETEYIEILISDEKFISYDTATTKTLIPLYIEKLEKYENDFRKISKNAETYNDFLRVLGESEHNFNKVNVISEKLTALKNLWSALKDFDLECDAWKNTKFLEVNTDAILNKIDKYYIHAKRAEMHFGEEGTAIKELIKNIKNFRESMQVIVDLNSSYLKSSDWDKIQSMFPDDTRRLDLKDYRLEFLIEIKAYQHQKRINEMALEAKNFEILKGKVKEINEMRKAIVFTIDSENKKVNEISVVVEKIEECQSKLNQVLASKYVRLLKPEYNENYTPREDPYIMKVDFDSYLEMIEDLKTFQEKWIYLQHILKNDSGKRFPENDFDKIDNEWKAIFVKLPNQDIWTIYNKLIKKDFFQKAIERLDVIQQKIEEKLKESRKLFERFFFISNDDLLYMLSKSNSIDDLKPYFIKIFEDISDLIVNQTTPTSKEIIGLISSSKEEFFFEINFAKKFVKITDKLEEWLKNLAEMMVKCLKDRVHNAVYCYLDITKDVAGHEMWLEKITKDLNNQNKDKLTTSNLSQIISTITHSMFCENTENAITMENSDNSSLEKWIKKIDDAIKSYAKLVNKENKSKNMRRIISNLITHYVHYSEILKDILGNESNNVDDFCWQQQLRSYLTPVSDSTGTLREDKYLIVRLKQLKSDIEYGYEFIGPSPRIVITPLTDRVWLTMTSGLYIKLGCSLGGPAGTGKTETTKDLAKFFGIQCIVFNCSEQIDYKILGNIFSGICLHEQGAFACLDEFNRINVEVLSVAASQLFEIRQALLKPVIQGEKRMVHILDLDNVVGKGGVFITMNPTYSGRTELPDNLKSLFRPITMMEPDKQTIAEVKLYSEGFTQSKSLAKKLIKIFNLAAQQLSQQDHYDFTLRSIGTVLSMAGNLKRRNNSISNDSDKEKEEEIMLLNALRDASFPKYIADDVKLFRALLSDLFPNAQVNDPSSPELEDELSEVIKTQNLDKNPFTIKKCLQIYDISNIRLGICLTGPAGTGKSTCLNLLEKSLTNLHHHNVKDSKYKEISKWIVNPKSITMGELFGQENEDTKTFTFGIFTRKVKEALALESSQDRNSGWVVLDGPIDTKWIENMNSVLDDSMILCLSNGERIKLKPHLKIFFEVEDLSQASLATVSRLGIVYFGVNDLDWQSYYKSWIMKWLPDETILTNELKIYLGQLFEDKVEDALENLDDFDKAGLVYIRPVMSQCMASMCNFLEIFLTRENGFVGTELPGLDNPDNLSRMKKKIACVFAISMVWGIFGCCNSKGFHKVESFMSLKFQEIKLEKSQLISEHYYDFVKNDFVKFSTDSTPFNFTLKTSYFKIFVPTIDTIRFNFVIESLLQKKKHMFITGETGVGKTAIISNILNKLITTDEWTFNQINFSAQTSSEYTQKSIESKLEKKKGNTIFYGIGGKRLVIFIDDINMPEPTEWGSHPPIELLRQYLDQGGFYDRPKFHWKKIEDSSLIVSGGPPIGGRSKVTNRFVRHFNLLCFPQPSKSVMISIFENILKNFLQAGNFKEEIKKRATETTLASVDLYEYISEMLKPIPSKFHYTFNLRDLSKIFQGILMIKSIDFETEDNFIRLWVHESLRVFGDRLINDVDLTKIHEYIVYLVDGKFKKRDWTIETLFKQNKIYFGEIHKGDFADRPYCEITSEVNITKRLNNILEMYILANKKNSMSIVFFDYAISHILRIARILRQERGNMVLIGHGGTGKQTLTKFTSFAMNCQFCTFNATSDYKVSQFRRDIKDIIKDAGANRKKTILLLTDNNVVSNFILEDINNLLNNGEVTNLFDQNEIPVVLNLLVDYMKSQGIPETREKQYETFVEMTRQNLHIIFCTSPVGDTLRIRFRKFPSLINCCTLNWFNNWPEEALVSCCQKIYSELQCENEMKINLVRISTKAHVDIEDLTKRFYSEVSRKVYVTPKSFLDMAELFKNLYQNKMKEMSTTITRLRDGIKKLEKTHKDIKKADEELQQIIPEIDLKSSEAKQYMVKVEEKNKSLESRKVVIRDKGVQVGNIVSNLTKITERIEWEKAEIDKRLDSIMRAVKKKLTKDKLLQLQKSKLENVEIKRVIGESAAFLLKQHKVSGTSEISKAISTEIDKIENIRSEVDNEKIPETIMKEFSNQINVVIPQLLQPFLDESKSFETVLREKTDETFKALYDWSKSTIEYWEINKKLQPLKDQLTVRKAEKEKFEGELNQLKTEYNELQDEATRLTIEYEELKNNLEELKNHMVKCNRRITNADLLIKLLSGEGDRWQNQLKTLEREFSNYTGNIFLSAVSISYLGPFSMNYRKGQMDAWIKNCFFYKIPASFDFSLENILADPIIIRYWNINGLPSDSVSTQNGIILFNNPKYSLMIDPQSQANIWLKKLYKNKILTIKGNIKEEVLKKPFEKITASIIEGGMILIENVGEIIDPIYYNLMSRTIFEEDGNSKVEFNSQRVDFNTDFKIFFTTKLANPHYPPEYFIKLNILNFTVTFEGLSEQLLSDVFKIERRDKYEQRDAIIEVTGKYNKELYEYSKEILQRLSEVNEDHILDDESLIRTLEKAKTVSDVVKKNMNDNEYIERDIDLIRNEYIPVAVRGSILYFAIDDLSLIDPMYQYSLDYFKIIFEKSIKKAQQTENIKERVRILEKAITEDIYKNIKNGIFESHKTIFSFMILIYIKKREGKIKDEEWNIFLKGPVSFDKTDMLENPERNYFSELSWDTLLYTENFFKLNNLSTIVAFKLNEFKKFFEELSEFGDFEAKFPGELKNYSNGELIAKNNILKLILIKIFRPDKILYFIKKLIVEELGKIFIDSSFPKLEDIYTESDERTPIIFILSQGADPTNAFIEFKNRFYLESGDVSKSLDYLNISLGQGQEEEARKAILERGIKTGTWVMLQNCHLFVTWMNELASIVQYIKQTDTEPIHPNFRLWLTSMPNPKFPVAILQNSLKLTTEPPTRIKANMKKIFDEISDQKMIQSKKVEQFGKIIFSMAMFHAVIQERKKFGPIGFNLRYDFNQTDYETSMEMINNYLNDSEDIPWAPIIYLVGDVNYGGRVTDEFDRNVMLTTLNKFISESLFEREKDENGEEIPNGKILDVKFSKSGVYYTPPYENLNKYRDYIDSLPLFDEPDLFGLNENANIIHQLHESNKTMNLFLNIIPKTMKEASGSNSIILELINNLLFNNLEKIEKKDQRHKSHDKLYENNLNHSLTIVMDQEIEKYNVLISKISNTLETLKNAIEGTVTMSNESDEIYNSLMLNKIPLSWAKVCYPSHKPLSSWFNDLIARVAFIRSWLQGGNPNSFWISGLFFPQGFITGVLQNHARETKIPVSDIAFRFSILDKYSESVTKAPSVFIY